MRKDYNLAREISINLCEILRLATRRMLASTMILRKVELDLLPGRVCHFSLPTSASQVSLGGRLVVRQWADNRAGLSWVTLICVSCPDRTLATAVRSRHLYGVALRQVRPSVTHADFISRRGTRCDL